MRSAPKPVRAGRRCRGDDGAVLIEFALLSPFLFLVLFGIIEFGWLFGHNLDTRHASREGARLAAVNYGVDTGEDGDGDGNQNTTSAANNLEQAEDIVAETCKRMDLADNSAVTLAFVTADTELGNFVRVTVDTTYNDLTGFFPFLGTTTLSSTVESRIEQDATYAEITSQPC